MRTALALSVLVLAASCTAAGAVEDAITMQTLATGSFAADDSGRKAVLAKTEAEFQQLFATRIADGNAPSVDFTKGVAVLLLAGQRSTGGYSVEPSSATVEGRTAVIRATVKNPPAGSMTTQVISSPWAVVFVNSTAIDDVRWEP